MDIGRRSVLGGFLVSVAEPLFAQDTGKAPVPAPAPRPLDAPIDVAVPVLPTPFTADGKRHLVYELHLTNFGRTECLLTRVDVLINGRRLAGHSHAELAKLLLRPGFQTKEPLKIGGGDGAAV